MCNIFRPGIESQPPPRGPFLAPIQHVSTLLQHGTRLQPYDVDSDNDNDLPLQIMVDSYPCQGVRIEFLEGKNPYLEWPWKEQAELAMAWDIQIKGSILTVWASTCLQSTPNANQRCHKCKTVEHTQRLGHIQDQIHGGIPETTPYKYHGVSGLTELLRWKDRQINTLELHVLNMDQRLDILTTSNLDYRRFIMAVSQAMFLE